MNLLRHLIIGALLLAFTALPAHAERLKIDYVFPPDHPAIAAKMHPAAKAGAGFWGGIGIWYCTVGPNEVGECDNAGQWAKGMLLWSAIGAGVGALIGAFR
jgi:hypothetical protein